jgi:hypothetical protein
LDKPSDIQIIGCHFDFLPNDFLSGANEKDILMRVKDIFSDFNAIFCNKCKND